MKRGIVMGKEVRSYTKDGEEKIAKTLYVLWDPADVPVEGMQGAAVEAMYVPRFDINNIRIGDYCDFNYDFIPSKNGMMAYLSAINVLGHAEIMIERPPVK